MELGLRFIILCFSFVFVGCTNLADNRAQKGATFSDDESAFVVVSLRMTTPYPPALSMSWREFDPSVSFFKDLPAKSFEVVRYNPNLALSKNPPNTKVAYIGYEVKEGTYALDRHSIQGAALHVVKMRPNTIYFSIRRGEVAYIGNYQLSTPVYGETTSLLAGREPKFHFDKTKLVTEERDEAAAKAFVTEQYPALTDAFVSKVPEPVTLKLP